MECVVCGGTNFTTESGFYFCSECQTQSQEVKEHAFQEEVSQVQIKSGKKTKKSKTPKDDQVSSWECYNVILLSLTEELIKLGADRDIKKIVKCLWMRYLEKLEVINLEHDQRPKLSLVHIKRDVNITFGVKKRKRRKQSSSESSVTESTSRRERSRKKAALAKSQYSEISSKIAGSSSLHNETLSSLRTPSERSETSEQIDFNKYSDGELRKFMSKKHLDIHKNDLEANLTCHKFTYKSWSTKYKRGIYFITPIKIYSILYISLLIKKDPIQLGDLFRFLREGHLNFDRFTVLFPDSYSNKVLNIHNHIHKSFYSQKQFRVTAAKLVEFLEVEDYIQCPNLINLAQRYCEEMSIPADILNHVKRILSRNPMRFGKYRKKFAIPNYEARVMSIIIFILKLLYGLDGLTEKLLSNYAEILNTKSLHFKMFDIQRWMEFLNYRHLIISEHHFPSYYCNNTDMNADLLMQYKKSHNIFADDRVRLLSDMIGYKNLLIKVQNLQNDYITHIEYPGSLKPFNNYVGIIEKFSNYKIINEDFQRNSLDFLIDPLKYLFELNRNVNFKHGGANDNWILEKMKTQNNCMYFIKKYDRNFETAELVKNKINKNQRKPICKSDLTDTSNLQKEFETGHVMQFEENLHFLTELYHTTKQDVTLNIESNNSLYDLHCNPYERYWLYYRGGIELASKQKFHEHFDKNADSFKLILNECARIIDQNCQELYAELQNTELYLIYCGHYTNAINRRKSSSLESYIKQAEFDW